MLEDTRVLIVDDLPEILTVLGEFLQLQGLRVFSASKGKEALAILDKEIIDIAIIDIKLPDISGISLLEQIKLRDPTIPVIMITGYFDPKLVVDSMKKGASDFMMKPIEFEKLTLLLLKAKRERELMSEKMKIEHSIEDKKKILLLNKELQAKINELTTMYHISTKFNSIRVDEDVFEKTLEVVWDVTGGKPVAYLIPNPEKAELVPLKVMGTAKELSRGVCVAPDFFSELTGHRKVTKIGHVVLLPILIKGRCVGLLGIEENGDGASKLKDGDLFLLKLVCEKASTVIENRILYESLFENVIETLKSLIVSINQRDKYTQGHCLRVAENCLRLGKYLGLGEAELEILKLTASLHDIGKTGIPDSILLKPGRLTQEEFELMKLHSVFGEQILGKFELLVNEARIIRSHHERYDGKGYPDGLSGYEIPYSARILAICDSYDAMISDRPYRKAMTKEEALYEIERCKGTQFDPELTEAFVEIMSSEDQEFLKIET